MKIVVTGGAGFIGSHLVDRLVELGHAVRVVDNFCTGKRENLAHVASRIELIEGDISCPEICRRACDDIEIIFHQAALPSVPRSVEEPALAHAANVDGTFNLLLAARDAGCRRVIYAASSSAYGESETLPKTENLTPQPVSPYAVNKLVGEYYCRVFSLCYGLETISLRYFNVFGPRQDPASQYAAAIPAFVTAILQGRQPTVFGDGEQTRDFTYIENVIHANLLAARAPQARGQVLNIACGRQVSVNEIIRQINRLCGTDIRPIYTDPRPGDVRYSLADISAARQVIGYSPRVHFEEGLQLSIDWYRENLL